MSTAGVLPPEGVGMYIALENIGVRHQRLVLCLEAGIRSLAAGHKP